MIAMYDSLTVQPAGRIIGGSASFPEYEEAIVGVTFGIPQFEQAPADPPSGGEVGATTNPFSVPWTITTAQGYVEALLVPSSVYKFAGGQKTGVDTARKISHVKWTFRRLNLPIVGALDGNTLLSALNNLVGKVNANSWFGMAPESALFESYDIQRTANTDGSTSYELAYMFDWRGVNWNKALHPNGTTGYAYITDGNGDKPFETGDFTTLP
jgi:hypothetical protein